MLNYYRLPEAKTSTECYPWQFWNCMIGWNFGVVEFGVGKYVSYYNKM